MCNVNLSENGRTVRVLMCNKKHHPLQLKRGLVGKGKPRVGVITMCNVNLSENGRTVRVLKHHPLQFRTERYICSGGKAEKLELLYAS